MSFFFNYNIRALDFFGGHRYTLELTLSKVWKINWEVVGSNVFVFESWCVGRTSVFAFESSSLFPTYGRFTYIWLKQTEHVGKYSQSHGAYGLLKLFHNLDTWHDFVDFKPTVRVASPRHPGECQNWGEFWCLLGIFLGGVQSWHLLTFGGP